jgi:hypothetical protein
MTIEAPTPVPDRPTALERDEVVKRLRDGCASERLSVDTFSARVDIAYRARSRAQLEELVTDLQPRPGLAERVIRRLSEWTARLEAAWAEARLERLELPAAASVATFGRARDCHCVLIDPSVSRTHARLRRDGGRWWLADLGSSNGTRVNGRRVVGEVEVFPGDRVAFAAVAYRLTAPR